MTGRRHRDIPADEIDWREGSGPGIRFAMFRTDEARANAPAVVLSKFAPGTVVEPHTHATNYFEYIVEGEQTVGKTRFGPGDIRIVKGGTGYGPIRVGPEGCTVLIVFEDASAAAMVTLPSKARLVEGVS
jgi:anti-sigma factor ChrR (cupin superfamily)